MIEKINYIKTFLGIDLSTCNYQLEIFDHTIRENLIIFKRDLTINLIDDEFTIDDSYSKVNGYIFSFIFLIFPYENSTKYEEVKFKFDSIRGEFFGFSRKVLVTQDY